MFYVGKRYSIFAVLVLALVLGALLVLATAAPAPAPPPDDDGGGALLFSDTFDRDADTFILPWADVLQQAPDRITTSSTYARKGTHSVKFTLVDGDNPRGLGERADLVGPSAYTDPAAICEGDERWIGWSILFPQGFTSQLTQYGWISVAEDGFSSPYTWPPLNFAFTGGPNTAGSFGLDSREHGEMVPDRIWSITPTYGQWMDIVTHVKFSKDPNQGYVELWVNGVRQTFSNGSQRYYQNTRLPTADACGRMVHHNYRDPNMGGTETIYQDEIKMGTSYAAVAP